MKFTINCPCGYLIPAEIPEMQGNELDLDMNPEFIDIISSGNFMSFTCLNCGKKHKPEKKFFINWKSKKLKYEVLPELERFSFYNKNEKLTHEVIIGFPEMADRISILKDGLEPIVIETLKYILLAKAYEDYPENDINAWYHGNDASGIEFHLDGIKEDEVAVMKVPFSLYENTLKDYRKNPKSEIFNSLFCGSYLSVQNILRPEILK